jgi:putative hydrolase of the HAD superfamily
MHGIQAITLDWGDTLAVNVGMPYQATQRRVFAHLAEGLRTLGGDPGAEPVARWMADLRGEWEGTADPVRNPEEREMDFAGMVDGWVRDAGLAPDAEPVRELVEACFDRQTDTVLPYTESAPVVHTLARRGYRIGILSHVPWPGPACRRWFERHGLAGAIGFYSLSCEVGRIKPHPAHYYDAVRQAGCPPAAILHVGDHPRRDIVGGRAAGLRTCLRRTERMHPEAELDACAPDLEILHLAELLDHLPGPAA